MITLLTALLIGVTNIGALTTLESDTSLAYRPDITVLSIGTSTLYRATAEGIIRDMENAEITEEVVKKLAAGGKICAVFGHRWVEVERLISVTSVSPYNAQTDWIKRRRHCPICGKSQEGMEVSPFTTPPSIKWTDIP